MRHDNLSSQDPHLFVYLDQGTSLDIFARAGILGRELAVYRRLVSCGHRLTLLSWGRGEDTQYRDKLGEIDLVHNTTSVRNRLWMPWILATLRGRAEGRPVLITNQLPGAAIAAATMRLTGVPCVVRFGYLRSENVAAEHGTRSRQAYFERLRERVAMGLASRVVTTSNRIRNQVVELYRIAPGRVTVLENYVDTGVFGTFPHAYDRSRARPFTVVTTCRLSREKNVDVLIKALQLLPDVRLLVVGKGPEGETLRRLRDDLDLPVEFLGTLDNAELPALYARCDAFALVSEYEGHPKAIIEAMACGLPVIGSRVRGIVDIVADGETGLLADIDPSAIAQACERLFDPKLNRELGEHGRAVALERFDVENYADRLWRLVLESESGTQR